MKKLLVLVCFGVLACQSPRYEADLIVFNANIYTVDEAFSKAEALVVSEGRFVAVGTTAEIQEKYTAPWSVDAKGKTIVPGLIDAHCHFYGLGLNQENVDLVGTQSFDEILEKLQEFAAQADREVIFGRGWDQNDWEVKEFPTKMQLDALFPDTPVALTRVDGHALLVNQKTLDMAGITAQTKVPGGEVILKDGKPTGVLVDRPMQLVYKVWPQPTREAQIRALKAAEEISFSYGLTTVNDAGLSREVIELIDSLQQAEALKMRVYAMVSNTPENLDHFLSHGKIKTPHLNVRSVKVYGDGALGSRGATLKAPYSDQPGHYGAMITPQDSLFALAHRIAAADYQMNTHAIGDSANIAVLRAYENVLTNLKDPRWKIEHAQILEVPDISRFSKKIIPSVQPTHATSDMYWAEDRIGSERIHGAYAFKSLLDQAGIVALGTDFPVEQVNPFLTFYAAVARMDLEQYPEGGFLPDQMLSREETLKGMTIWAAYSNFEEAEKGSIESGKWADFVILSQDIMEVPVSDIPETKAEVTFLGGKKVN